MLNLILGLIPIFIYFGVAAVYVASLIALIKKDKKRSLNYFKGGSKILLVGIILNIIFALIIML